MWQLFHVGLRIILSYLHKWQSVTLFPMRFSVVAACSLHLRMSWLSFLCQIVNGKHRI